MNLLPSELQKEWHFYAGKTAQLSRGNASEVQTHINEMQTSFLSTAIIIYQVQVCCVCSPASYYVSIVSALSSQHCYSVHKIVGMVLVLP